MSCQMLDDHLERTVSELIEISVALKWLTMCLDVDLFKPKSDQHTMTNDLVNLPLSNNFLPINVRHTRMVAYSYTFINHVFTGSWPRIVDSAVHINDISDHLSVDHLNNSWHKNTLLCHTKPMRLRAISFSKC